MGHINLTIVEMEMRAALAAAPAPADPFHKDVHAGCEIQIQLGLWVFQMQNEGRSPEAIAERAGHLIAAMLFNIAGPWSEENRPEVMAEVASLALNLAANPSLHIDGGSIGVRVDHEEGGHA